jgi:hypothetical protein
MVQKTPGGYVPLFPESESNTPLMVSLRDAHAKVIAVRREFLERKNSGFESMSSLAEELSDRLKRECLPVVRAGRQRLAELARNASDSDSALSRASLAGIVVGTL